jgi:GH24 family phage-related lysozyme (muramidase)
MTLWTRIREIAGNMNVRKPPRVAHPHVSKPDRQQKPEPLPNGIKAANEAINATAPIPVGNAVTLPPVTHPGPVVSPKVMTTSPEGLALIKSFESCAKAIGGGRFEAYPDPAPGNNGLPVTIGWGSTRDFQGKPIKLGTVWTQEQCDRKKAEDMAEFEAQVRAILGSAATTQPQFDALTSFAYNLGSDALRKSTLIRKHRAGDYEGAAREFARWNKAGGRVMRGLVRRREAEAQLYRKGS